MKAGRHIAFALAAVAVSSVPAAAQSPAPFVYEAADGEAARVFWGDIIAIVDTLDPSPSVPISVQIASAAGLDFAYLSGAGTCGAGGHGCPIRVYRDGGLVAEFSACEDLASHAVALDGTRFYDCGTDRALADMMR